MKRICVFFDTNILEKRGGDSLLSLSRIDFPKEPFYDVVRFLDDNDLWEDVDLLIPDMVVMEIKHHMITDFQKKSNSLDESINSYKNTFGELIDISSTLLMKPDDYPAYVDELFVELFRSPKNHLHIVECQKDSETMDILIEKAIKTKAPFSESGSKNKKYTDAGFKDAVIYETIVKHINDNDAIGIFFTQDHDYGDTPKEFKLIRVLPDNKAPAFEDFKLIVKKHFNILEQDDFEAKLKDPYIKSRILEEADLRFDDYNFIKIISGTYHSDEENIYADIVVRINNDKLIIRVEYNRVANEIAAEYIDQFEE